jgi:hypothetical protein
VLSGPDRALLEQFADVIIPPDDAPGGAKLGVIAYVERLLTALEYDPPRVYGGGPFSDRSGSADNQFVNFVVLDRASVAAWVKAIGDLRAQLEQGLAGARALHITDPVALYNSLPEDFQALVFDLVTEAAFAAPEYGGNPKLAGWQMIHFEGDSLPRGYSQWNGTGYDERPDAPMSTANPSDPEPLTSDVRTIMSAVVQALGGRVKP